MTEHNPHEQTGSASHGLEWQWSPSAFSALTKYPRDILNEPSSEDFAQEILKTTGNVYEILSDIQRELGGVRLDYGEKRWLDFGIYGSPDWFQEYQTLNFTAASHGVPGHLINTQGYVIDFYGVEPIFLHPKPFVEWHVALRDFYFNHRGQLLKTCDFQVRHRTLAEMRHMLEVFASSRSLTLKIAASDVHHLMWEDGDTQLMCKSYASGLIKIWLRTAKEETFKQFADLRDSNSQ